MTDPIRYGGVVAGQEEIDAVTEVLRGQMWGSGPLVAEFERQAARVQDRKHALFVNSGSSALLLALATLPKGSKVAMPALQFPTLYSAAVWCGLRPILIDCDDSLNMSVAKMVSAVLEHGPAGLDDPVSAVAFVHMAGNPTNVAEVASLCRDTGLTLIEDNCEGFGGTVAIQKDHQSHSWRPTGCWGDISCTSTHGAHQISTGEGGLVFCDDDEAYAKMRRLRDWGRAYGAVKLDGYYEHYTFSEFGLNLHATDIQAALGLIQIRRLHEFASIRRQNYAEFRAGLADLPVTLPRVNSSAFPSWYVFPLLCDDRDGLRAHLEACGIETRTILVGNLLRQPLGIEAPACPVADDVFRRGLWFSVHPRLTRGNRAHIIASVREFFACGS
jgi:dTDP-4-dehydro-2,6-dideoxy-D-glucose 3-dehydratase